MKNLDEKELEKVKGGFSFWAFASIVSATIFVVGVLDGIARPLRCN